MSLKEYINNIISISNRVLHILQLNTDTHKLIYEESYGDSIMHLKNISYQYKCTILSHEYDFITIENKSYMSDEIIYTRDIAKNISNKYARLLSHVNSIILLCNDNVIISKLLHICIKIYRCLYVINRSPLAFVVYYNILQSVKHNEKSKNALISSIDIIATARPKQLKDSKNILQQWLLRVFIQLEINDIMMNKLCTIANMIKDGGKLHLMLAGYLYHNKHNLNIETVRKIIQRLLNTIIRSTRIKKKYKYYIACVKLIAIYGYDNIMNSGIFNYKCVCEQLQMTILYEYVCDVNYHAYKIYKLFNKIPRAVLLPHDMHFIGIMDTYICAPYGIGESIAAMEFYGLRDSIC